MADTKYFESKTIKDHDGNDVELKVLDFKGKPYMEVAYRMIWFRIVHEDWGISTELLELVDSPEILQKDIRTTKDGEVDTISKIPAAAYAVFKATITNQRGDTMATGTKKVEKSSFPAFIEKAETGAVGRALMFAGIGTQYAIPDMDEAHDLDEAPTTVIADTVAKRPVPAIQRTMAPEARAIAGRDAGL